MYDTYNVCNKNIFVQILYILYSTRLEVLIVVLTHLPFHVEANNR